MKFGFNLLLWTKHVTEDILPLCAALKAAGYDGVELPVFEGDPAFYASLRGRLADLGLASTAHGILPDAAHNPLSPDPAVRRAGEDHHAWLVDCAAALGAEVLAGPYHQPLAEFSGRGPSSAEWQALVETQGRMARRARAAGVLLALEPLNRFECDVLNTCADAARLVAEVGVPGYGYLYDTFHASIEESAPLAALRDTLEAVAHVHLSENDRGTLGRGHVDVAGVIDVLTAGGYEGWLTIDAFGLALPALAAATRVWRPLFGTEAEVYQVGIAVFRRALAA